MSRKRVLCAHRIGVDRHIVTYLVDANVLSETTKPDPSAAVVAWLRANERGIAVDPIILGEIRFGICLMSSGKRRCRLERWFERGVATMVCLSWDAATGLRWAELLADLRHAGLAMSVKDSM